MGGRVFLAGVFAVCWVYGVSGYGSGAPESACTSMIPGHKNASNTNQTLSAQTSASPYMVKPKSNYTVGKTLTVTLSGSENFSGFLLQARAIGGNAAIGAFQTGPAKTQLKNCTGAGNYVTHTDTSGKNNLDLMWSPPSDLTGSIEFVCTFARNHDEYWVKVTSSQLSATGSAGSGVVNTVVNIRVFALVLMFGTLWQLF